MNTKEYLEKRNDLVDKMDKIVNTAKSEDRAVTEEEKENFTNYENEVKAIDSTLEMEEKMNKFNVKEVIVTDKTSIVNKLEAKYNKHIQKVVGFNNWNTYSDDVKEKMLKDYETFKNVIRQVSNTDTPVVTGDNGILIPQTVANEIISMIEDICPIYEMSEHFSVVGDLFLPIETEDTISMEYADEFTDAESGTIKTGNVKLSGYLARCLVKISKSLINNSKFDIVGYVEKKIAYKAKKFMEQELVIGTSGKIEGLRGVTQVVETAVANKVGSDDLIDLQDTIIEDFQANSIFIMNRATRTAIRKLKDGQGNYLLNRDFEAKWGYRLLGKDVYTTDSMPTIANADDKAVIYYGDLSGLGTKISEAPSIQVLNERYAVEHALGLLAFIQMDGKVTNTQKLAKLVIKGTVVSA